MNLFTHTLKFDHIVFKKKERNEYGKSRGYNKIEETESGCTWPHVAHQRYFGEQSRALAGKEP